MPIGNNRDDQQGTLQQGAAGMMGVGGPQAGTGNATKPAIKKTKGSGFVGLQSYLTSNPNAASQASEQLRTESTGLGQKIAGATGAVTGQIQGQQATGMGQQYKDVSMSPVQELGKEEGSLKNKAAALASGDYTKFASAQGYKPMTAGEGALYGGLMGAQSSQFAPQAQQIQGQDAVGAALKGLATTQDTQRAAYNQAVSEYQRQYNEDQTRRAQQAASEQAAFNARPRPMSTLERIKAAQGPIDVGALNQQILDNANTEIARLEARRRTEKELTGKNILDEEYRKALTAQEQAERKAPPKDTTKEGKALATKRTTFSGGRGR